MSKVQFNKPPLSLAEQVALLRNRGMLIHDHGAAEDALLRLNYYRFSGYALHYEEFEDRRRTHRFKAGTTFDHVIELHDFDSRLRAMLFRYIEPIEVAFRAAICYELSIRTNDAHWYMDKDMYVHYHRHDRLLEECEREYRRSDEIFIKSYREKYDSPPLPPSWMMSEILSLGRWSKLYSHLVDREAKKAIASHLMTKPYFLQSWMHSLSVLRNLCAHHCRIWNREFTIRPHLPQKLQELVIGNGRIAALIVIITHVLKPLGKNLEFQGDWDSLLSAYPDVPKVKMGIPQ